MKALHSLFLAAGLALAAAHPAAIAAPAAAVEAVQMPAWVERGDGRKAPLSPGMELNAGDRVRTGSNSRLLLKLSEGSLVKLGENGVLKIDELRPDEGGIFKAVLKVAEGAFRFTTDALMKHRRRLVNISVANVTTGIRGTDLWGKAASNDRQVVCLIEGSIEVAAEGEKPVLLDQPRQFYQRNQGETAPVGMIDPALLAQWAQETEIAVGQGAARAGGKWKVLLLSAASQEGALAVYAEVRANGYAAEIHPAKAGDRRVYNVVIGHLPSKGEAEALAAQLKGKMGVATPRVSS
ncbi:MAG: SPOR domain-containing protein [Proteobacteria bacterium]|nr:SPOR domain-containing protein [Pseudomonadota bacterium]